MLFSAAWPLLPDRTAPWSSPPCSRKSKRSDNTGMARPTRTIDATAAEMQQVLERDYAQLEWRVLLSPAPRGTAATEHQIHVHARTRDFRYRCRVSRSWPVVQAAPTLRLLVAELAREAEQLLGEQATPPQAQGD